MSTVNIFLSTTLNEILHDVRWTANAYSFSIDAKGEVLELGTRGASAMPSFILRDSSCDSSGCRTKARRISTTAAWEPSVAQINNKEIEQNMRRIIFHTYP